MRVDGNRPPFAGFNTSVSFADPMIQLQAEAMEEEQGQMMVDSDAEMNARAAKQEANAEAVEAMRDQATSIAIGGAVSGSMLVAGGALQVGGAATAKDATSATNASPAGVNGGAVGAPGGTPAAANGTNTGAASSAPGAGDAAKGTGAPANAAKGAPQPASNAGANAPKAPDPNRTSHVLGATGETLSKLSEPGNALLGEAPAKKAEADATAARNRAEQKQWAADDAKERRQRAEKQQDTAMSQVQQELQAQRETTSFLLQRM